jgi:hypothetical protein
MKRLSSKPTEALKFYNKCRGDKTYGRIAAIEMANLCLNPENEIRSDEEWRKKNMRYFIKMNSFISFSCINFYFNFFSNKQDSSKIAQETAIKLLQVIFPFLNNFIFLKYSC